MNDSQFFAAGTPTGAAPVRCSCPACTGNENANEGDGDGGEEEAADSGALADLADRIADLEERIERVSPPDIGDTNTDPEANQHAAPGGGWARNLAAELGGEESTTGDTGHGTPPGETRREDGHRGLAARLAGDD